MKVAQTYSRHDGLVHFCPRSRFNSRFRIALWLGLISLVSLDGLAQRIDTPEDLRSFKEFKASVFAEEKRINDQTSLDEILEIYTDIGKIHLTEKKYAKALNYLLKAKNLNKNNASNYTHYNVAFGSLFMELHANSVAIEFFKKEIHRENHLNNYYQLASVGSLYLRLFDYENAEFHFKLQLDEARVMNDFIAVASAKNNIGLTLFQAGEIDEAIGLFSQSIDELKKNKNKWSTYFQLEYPRLLSNIYGNLGECYKVKHQYDVALKYFNTSYTLYDDPHNQPVTLILFQANSHISLNQLPAALKLILSIDQSQLSLNEKIEFYATKKNYNLCASNFEELASNLTQIESLYRERDRQNVISNDLMNQLVSKLLVSEAQESIQFEKRKKDNLLKQYEVRQLNNRLTTFIMIVTCLSVVSVLLLVLQVNKNKRKTSELERQRLELEEEKLNQKLTVQNNHLTDFAIEKRVKDLKSKELLSNLQELKKNDSEHILSAINQLIMEIKQNDVNAQIGRFHQINEATELLLLEFKMKLIEKHTDLSESDLLLCQLIRLKLSNKEIANFKNITLESVKVAKNRLKKKLKIDGEVNVTSYLHQF